MEITFVGAAREVTGSCHILRVNGHTVLLDCGMFQGKRQESADKNRMLPLPIKDLDAVVLQHRALWSDQGGTWGLPGGALHQGEEAVHGALREAREEAAVPPENVRVLFTSVFDVGYWTYTTVVVEVVEAFEPEISDPESLELQWVPVGLVGDKELHPGFGVAWPALRHRLLELDAGTAGTPK